MRARNGQNGFHVILQMIFTCSAILISIVQSVSAQAGQSELTGTITDTSGAAIAGANVTLTETATNRNTETTTGEIGVFLFTIKKRDFIQLN